MQRVIQSILNGSTDRSILYLSAIEWRLAIDSLGSRFSCSIPNAA